MSLTRTRNDAMSERVLEVRGLSKRFPGVIVACVIGGTSLKGGRGTVIGVLFGALIMTSLLNGMTLLAVAPEMKYMARGVVLILAVWMDVTVAKK